MDKSGESKEETFFAMFTVIVISLFLIFGIFDINKTVDNSAVQQDFVSKEISSSINSLTSITGNGQIYMSFNKNYSISIKGDIVVVKVNEFDVGFSSPIINSGSVDITDTTLKKTDNIIISKQERKISVYQGFGGLSGFGGGISGGGGASGGF